MNDKMILKMAKEHAEKQAKNYRKEWKEKMTESENIEEYGLNEFLGGKAEAWEEMVEFINEKIRIKTRLAYLRQEIENESISYEEIAELESLKEYIDKNDVLLLQWAGVKENA